MKTRSTTRSRLVVALVATGAIQRDGDEIFVPVRVG